MKNSGLLNSDAIRILSRLGHRDMIAVTDFGFPFPVNGKTQTLDLSIARNLPRYLDIVKLLMDDYCIESVLIADETKDRSKDIHRGLLDIVEKNDNRGQKTEVRYMPHSDFKNLVLHGAEREEPVFSMIRTGEFTPYSNIILVAGVPFG